MKTIQFSRTTYLYPRLIYHPTEQILTNMYNGIGLPTPRGSGTNGYVQRNLAHVKKTKQLRTIITAKSDKIVEKTPNFELILHQKKREIEAKCLRLRRQLEDDGWRHERIEEEIIDYRKSKLRDLERLSEEQHGDKLKRSFGIKKDYVDGSAVTQMKKNPEQKVKREKEEKKD